jgi:hypothetical protein
VSTASVVLFADDDQVCLGPKAQGPCFACLPVSEAFRYSGTLPTYSPNGAYLAVVEDYRLILRHVDTLQVLQIYSCVDRIKSIEWCCRSDYVLCALLQRSIVQVGSDIPVSVNVKALF